MVDTLLLLLLFSFFVLKISQSVSLRCKPIHLYFKSINISFM